ncbi:hypothetical protein F9C07_2278780 [Aspergillus flavus]|uniref:Uncharacterized protein n=1 Tax=Aspergillus flavus (strain ATCC 200026 / FGSC A1120 / IAM 13836 / NRRL 3357 / JCM 12722 / SRRC 167) TaxID=332952 RepID=A0A7G5JSM2_ASPFN|nr:uncharacterized protein G4B84_001780 [Aspergillus flavus NRRL3357]QMW26535.1 hypothetical protein G4B84_001780 [Aspergillus flavus NRRL3357]QMW38614.1 hypothetical protein G4B11_001850 [Aspergillus flavus]QRD87342.1 hypothetical protein F9C07_2278780 [Aspergillus flavus]
MAQDQRTERVPRGKYARLICQGCRSRKIKCVLPDLGDMGPLGVPQPPETSCERCRNLNLECIIERTTLGRPPAKSSQRKPPQTKRSARLEKSEEREDEVTAALSDLEIKEYLFSEAATGEEQIPSQGGSNLQPPQRPGERAIFRSMTQVNAFMSSVLGKDAAFGCEITHATSRWSQPLSDLISDDMAILLDSYLVWHRSFLPETPTLVNLRNRLTSEEVSSTNPATNLLFALLCLTSFDIAEPFAQRYPHLKRSLQLAVSSYGQEFIFSPPTHPDSVAACLFLAEFRPTLLATSQFVAHKAVSPEVYVNLAYRIAERLNTLPTRDASFFDEVMNPQSLEFERRFNDSVQELKILSLDFGLDGFLSKTLPAMRGILGHMQPHIDAYQHVLKYRECSPTVIFHIQWNMSFYILLEGLIHAKQCWSNPESLFLVVEEVERKCQEQIQISNSLLLNATGQGRMEELSAARSLLEMKFHWVFAGICGLGLLYTSVLRTRLIEGKNDGDPDIQSNESLQIVDQVAGSVNSPPDAPGQYLSGFLKRFGEVYPQQLVRMLESFLECAEVQIDGIAFNAPLQQVVYGIVFVCKNLVENNFVQVRVFGRLAHNHEKQLALFPKCARCIRQMAVEPWKSTKSAFATGCVYAASSKIIYGLHNILDRLRTELAKGTKSNEALDFFNIPPDLSSIGVDLDMPFWDAWNLWPHVGSFSPFDNSTDLFDWGPGLNYDGDFEPMNISGMR